MPTERYRGTIDRLEAEKGYGFVICTAGDRQGERFFMHQSACDAWATELHVGQRLSFVPIKTERGWRATDVQLLAD
jgi:cold shock CspA family protein